MRKKEKRQFIRLKAYHLVKYRPLLAEKESVASVLAAIRDIGGGGICLRTEECLPVSCVIEVRINFPNIATSIFALARVVWVKQRNKSRRYEIGAQFINIDEEVRKTIEDQVRSVDKIFKKTGLFKKLFLGKRVKKR